jgi:hypothetical protein
LNKIDKFGFIKKKVRHAKTGDVVRNKLHIKICKVAS